MPVEAKPLFRPDVLRAHLAGFAPPAAVEAFRPKLAHWASLIATGRIDTFNEQEILADFLTDFFVTLLGYTRPADGGQRYTISRERHVEIDGKFADAVLGEFNGDARFVVALEGKGSRDPLDRPFAGRRMSAVDQGYRYAINLPCDWIIVTSMRQTRLYHKGSDQATYERFDTEQLATSDAALLRFVFLLGAERVVPPAGDCHFASLLAESERVGRELTKKFYVNYANMRQDAFEELARDNPAIPRRDVLACTQKLLDRVLFMAFSEDRGLLPTETIRRAYEHRDPYHPRPIWDNFRGLFGFINQGNAALGIHAYNGGLFADDPVLDRLTVSDQVCRYFHDLGSYDYRPPHQAISSPLTLGGGGVGGGGAGGSEGVATSSPLSLGGSEATSHAPTSSPLSPGGRDAGSKRSTSSPLSLGGRGAGGEGEGRLIDVDILGHIFEQSITDLERLRNELDGLAEPVGAEKHRTRRKKEGAFYTPSFITRYIIEQALGGVLRDRFAQLRQRHESAIKGRSKLPWPTRASTQSTGSPSRSGRLFQGTNDTASTYLRCEPVCTLRLGIADTLKWAYLR